MFPHSESYRSHPISAYWGVTLQVEGRLKLGLMQSVYVDENAGLQVFAVAPQRFAAGGH